MNNWHIKKEETRGMVEGKLWITNGKDTALFKPDSPDNPSHIEVGVYKIAKALGISCAKTEKIKFLGMKGIVSYDFREEGYVYCPVDSLHEKSKGFTANSHDSKGKSLTRVSQMTMQEIRTNERLKPLEKGAVDMLFLDCLVGNIDRHGGNWEIKLTKDGEVAGLAPLFDHGMCQWGFYSHSMDCSAVLWDNERRELNHFEMFQKLCGHYPQQVKELLDKCDAVELNKFCSERLDEMRKIYAVVHKVKEPPLLPEQEEIEFVIERQIGGTFTVEADGVTKEYSLAGREKTIAALVKDFGIERDGAETLLSEAQGQSAVDNALAKLPEQAMQSENITQSNKLNNDIVPPLPRR